MGSPRIELFPGVEIKLGVLEVEKVGFLALRGEHQNVIMESPAWPKVWRRAYDVVCEADVLDVSAYRIPHAEIPTLLMHGIRICDASQPYVDPTYVPVYGQIGNERSTARGFNEADTMLVSNLVTEIDYFTRRHDVLLSADATEVAGWGR